MKNNFTDILDAIADTIKDRADDIFETGDTAAEVKEKLTEIEKD